jgi:peptidoglycan/LPS O-acetylase OafA/YrhL
MSDESSDRGVSTGFHVGAFLAAATAIYGVIALVLAVALSDKQLSGLELDRGACVVGGVLLLVCSALTAERALAARRDDAD